MLGPRRNYRQPFLRPRPAPLSELADRLAEIERAGIYTNHGPHDQLLEARLVAELFAGTGDVATCASATTGLILAIRHQMRPGRRYALLPSFTFAAPAHAAAWNGLTPLWCDIDPNTWLPAARSEIDLLEAYRDEIAVMIPQATFGNCLDLSRYEDLSRAYGVPVVVDAAPALGSRDVDDRQFGTGSPFPIVYSMHATKTFATAEGGLVYCRDPAIVDDIRTMANFGFGKARQATMPGLNGKLSEVAALLALAKLDHLDAVVEHRSRMVDCYRRALGDVAGFQVLRGTRHAYQYVPVRLHDASRDERDALVMALADDGIEVAHYFSPHLAEHEYFAGASEAGNLDITAAVAGSILSLPMHDCMTEDEIDDIATAVVTRRRMPSGPETLGEGRGRTGVGGVGCRNGVGVPGAADDALLEPHGVGDRSPLREHGRGT